ncbi:hypothetical protein FPV67DRAFT_243445 [Lyophyllum atratum]|nr:hypothetical protein FPV67DRAFT_243445 [Lyophyllum atratum]
MSEQVCAVCIAACCDVLAGICLDFMSLRKCVELCKAGSLTIVLSCFTTGHTCTEDLCNRNCRSQAEEDPAEREPLIAARREEPSSQPPMRVQPPS